MPKESMIRSDDDDHDDNLNVIVHAVLDELDSMRGSGKLRNENENDRCVLFAKDIDSYLKSDHTKRNKYLATHDELG